MKGVAKRVYVEFQPKSQSNQSVKVFQMEDGKVGAQLGDEYLTHCPTDGALANEIWDRAKLVYVKKMAANSGLRRKDPSYLTCKEPGYLVRALCALIIQ